MLLWEIMVLCASVLCEPAPFWVSLCVVNNGFV